MSWTTTQQQQPQYQLWSAPTGWSGSWPPTAPAGYPGPPPVPAGVNPQAWTSGRWQFNPMFRGPVPQAGQTGIPAWVPHPSWGPQVASAYAAAAANYNPYKRQPNPGDRDYWSTKLSDNPLGLENMHIRDTEHKKTRENGVMHTPWVWVPKTLCESAENEGSTDAPSGRDGKEEPEGREGREGLRSQGSGLHSREPSRSRQERSGPTAETSRYPQERQGTSYGSSGRTPAPDATSGPSRAQESRQRYDSITLRSPRDASQTRAEEPNVVPPPPPNMPNGYTSAYSTYSQQHQRQRSRDVSPRPADPQQPRTSPNPPTSSASAAAAAMQSKPSALEAFSSKQQLHPTFSPSIVRTPKHYNSTSISTPTRRSTTDDSRLTSAHTRRSSGEPSSQSTTPSRRLSGDDTHYSTSNPTARRSTHEDSHTTVSPGHHTHGPIYAPASTSTSASNTPSRSNSLSKPPSRSNSLSKRRSSAPTPASGSPTADSAPLPFLASFSEEPEGVLSPLITAPRGLASGSSPRESPGSRNASNGRELGRSSTYPSLSASSTFESIPEDRAVPQSRTPKPQDHDRDRNRHSDPESTPYAGVRSPPRSSHASPEAAAPQKISRSVTYPVLDARQPASYSSRSPPAHTHTHNYTQSSYASSRSPSTQPSPSHTSSRSPTTYTTRSPNAPARSPRSPTEATYSRSREPSRSRGASPTRNHNPLPRPPMPSSYPTTVSSASASAYSSASKVQPASGYSSGTHASSTHTSANPRSASAYPSDTQPSSTYTSGSQPASSYPSSAQPAATYSSGTQTVPKYPSSAQPVSTYSSGSQPSSHHHHRSGSTQPSAMYTSASQTTSAHASHHQQPSSYSSGTHHHHTSSSTTAAYTSASSAYSSAPTPQPAHRSPSRRVRKGYWNRRGDHLVYDQNRWCIVYAPRDLANPSELSQYPAPTEGFMDHLGSKAKYDPSVPELPESLPLHGEPPKRPYQEFVQYVHV